MKVTFILNGISYKCVDLINIKGGDTINKLEKEFLIKLAEGINNYNYDYTGIREMLLVLINGDLSKSDLEKL